MNRENEEQRAVSQTFCGALQKEPNCKCLVLSVLIYGCLAAVTWCRCANVTKIVINFSHYPIKSTKNVSPCDDGYIYIPIAFMGMLYLVYLVECYHSPIRLNLLHAENQDSVMARLNQLRMAQPTIWWKAVSYHYVRRKRQITRYRNGDNYTSTQVYYERVNTHAATSFYYYDYCGVRDISKELVLDPKVPITKIMLSKGFAFSNMRSAAEFEETRSRFFAEQELRDDYMEMREGLDLGHFAPTTLVAVLGNPWFTNSYIYWCLSALLLSWPLRVIIEYNTQYADYQVTKLFGVNYDTPTSDQEPIHASNSQLSQPGSYMLAPSYSEALLMDTGDARSQTQQATSETQDPESCYEMAPSYSEALLYERAEVLPVDLEGACACPCHEIATESSTAPLAESTQVTIESVPHIRRDLVPSLSTPNVKLCDYTEDCCNRCKNSPSTDEAACLSTSKQTTEAEMPRELSEPNLRRSEYLNVKTEFLRANGKSLENILENEEEDSRINTVQTSEIANDARYGAIPKRYENSNSREPMKPLANSRTYFCLKSILRQSKRRYTLVTTHELESFENRKGWDSERQSRRRELDPRSFSNSKESLDGSSRRTNHSSWSPDGYRDVNEDATRTLIFPSPIREICPDDPFGGKKIVPRNRNLGNGYSRDETNGVPVFTRLRRSLIERDREACQRARERRRHQRTFSVEPEYLFPRSESFSQHQQQQQQQSQQQQQRVKSRRDNNNRNANYENGVSFPPYDGLVSRNTRIVLRNGAHGNSNGLERQDALTILDERPSSVHIDDRSRLLVVERAARCNRGLTEPDLRLLDSQKLVSKRTNLNMETSL